MTAEEAEKYKNYPEGSGGKKTYDMFYLPFQDYLYKYYKNPDLTRWNYINSKFVTPQFDGTTWVDYIKILGKIKSSFLPVESKRNEFWAGIQNDSRFSVELKQFFTFLFSIGFFREMSFEQWLNVSNWMHPWFDDGNKNIKAISELIRYEYSENYIKTRLATLSIF
jgi:hypothetical protein